MSRGRVFIVGAGPGDPGLLTVKGRGLLRAADAVVHDGLVAPRIVALAHRAERYDVGKSRGNAAAEQDAIEALLVRLGREGKRVVRLKGGDPFVFGRTGSELDALVSAGIPFEIVPGVSSAIAAPAYAGVPVTDRRAASAFVVVTATQGGGAPGIDWSAIARVPTIVILMGGARVARTLDRLIEQGIPPSRPAIAVEWGTTPRQRVVGCTLGVLAREMAAAGLASPVTIVVGEVAAFAARYGWTPTPSRSARARRARPSVRLRPRPARPRSRSPGTIRGTRAPARPAVR